MLDVLQIVGAVGVLIPFVAVQLNRLTPESLTYLWFNLFGAALLAVLAAIDQNWGFLLLEVVWGGVAVVGLVRRPATV